MVRFETLESFGRGIETDAEEYNWVKRASVWIHAFIFLKGSEDV